MINFFNIIASSEGSQAQQELSLQRYVGDDILNREVDPTRYDTMQLFLGCVVPFNGYWHMYYIANGVVDMVAFDIDRVHLQKKPIDGNYASGWAKEMDGNQTKVIIDGDKSGETYIGQAFARSGFYDPEFNHIKMFVAHTGSGTSVLRLHTSTDGVNFTSQGQVMADWIGGSVVKRGINDYVMIASRYSTYVSQILEVHTSTDCLSWTYQRTLNLGSTFTHQIIQQDGLYYVIGNSSYIDDIQSTNLPYEVVYWTTTDFVTFSTPTTLITANRPSERGTWGCSVVPYNNNLILFHDFNNIFEKFAREPYSGTRYCVLNRNTLQAAPTTINYPSYVTHYYPLYPDDEQNPRIFSERISGLTTEYAFNWSKSNDGPRFMIFSETSGLVFPSIIYNGEDFAFKVRISDDKTPVQVLKIGTDIDVRIESNKLRVKLNNGTKDYTSIGIIQNPIGTLWVDARCYIGFIFKSGALQLCIGDTIGVPVTMTADGAMSSIDNNASDVEIINGNPGVPGVQALGVVFMSGQTDEQWQNLDL